MKRHEARHIVRSMRVYNGVRRAALGAVAHRRSRAAHATARRGAVCLVLAAGVLTATAAAAHTRSISYSRWDLDGRDARAELRVSLLELAGSVAGPPTADALASAVTLTVDGRICPAADARRLDGTAAGWAVYRWTVRCTADGPRVLRTTLFAGTAAHGHLVRVADGGDVRERLLAAGDAWPLDGATRSAPLSWTRYVRIGIAHILGGADHLVFLLALLLLATSLRELATLVTSFTAAHTLTLGLGALAVVRPDAAAVEALIGFSIVLVAVENAWLAGGRDAAMPRALVMLLLAAAVLALTGATTVPPLAWLGLATFAFCHFRLLGDGGGGARALVAFAFGLVHGFGFAGNLLELELPAHRLVPALFGFNLGVELGQLALIAIAWPLLRALVRRGVDERRLALAGAAPILAVGVFWLVSRSVR